MTTENFDGGSPDQWDDLPEIQSAAVKRLERKGFGVNRVCPNYGGDLGFFVLMSRKRRGTTRLAEVEADGLVNGSSLEDYLKSL